ncbi:MAG: 16S rRNA (cytidine(1402)-2'-O)-methyltransferase [Actinomycetota bacterium]|nr:16S rRNA (cytidine(1402)-2'-O)-methyltransferase [Actinomycetota bacterium]
MSGENGKLYICATPIGNLEDITLRALRILKEADYIAAEDTRHTRKLLSYYDIHTRLTSYHEHNEAAKAGELIALMESGAKVALVSDAGMPGISDPGHKLIKRCIDRGIAVEAVPGASALITALVISGLPTDSFVFQGFMPRKQGERVKLLAELTGQERTVILFESPRRLKTTLQEIAEVDADRDVVIARELTKKFEQVLRGTAGEMLELLDATDIRGEVVLLIAPPKEKRPRIWAADDLRSAVVKLMDEGTPKKQAILEVTKDLGVGKRLVYESVKDIHT